MTVKQGRWLLIALSTLLLAGTAISTLGNPASHADGEPVDSPVAYALEALRLVEKSAYYAERINWTAANAEVVQSLRVSSSRTDAYNEIRRVLHSLGDNHSLVISPDSAQRFESSGGGRMEVRLDSPLVGYIRLDGFSGGDSGAIDSYINNLSSLVETIASKGVCGWIVDLRENPGGNMWPMLAGLKSILGTDNIGAFVDRHGRRSFWTLDGLVKPASHPTQIDAPVAVLIGNTTASSGEAIVVAFAGRPRTRTFGQPTRGLATANQLIKLSDGAMLFVTTSVFADRNGRPYGTAISPDDLAVDNAASLSLARSWLDSQTKRKSGLGANACGVAHTPNPAIWTSPLMQREVEIR